MEVSVMIRVLIREMLLQEAVYGAQTGHLITEAAVTPLEAQDKYGLLFKVQKWSDLIEIFVHRKDDIIDGVGILKAEAPINPCNGAWEIKKSNVRIDGLGPLLYDLMFDLVHPAPLTPDRITVNINAKRVWEYYFWDRPDIESIQLDNLKNEITPPQDDNCNQNSAETWVADLEDLDLPRNPRSIVDAQWYTSPLAKAYKRKDGRTPTLDALNNLGIIEIKSRKK